MGFIKSEFQRDFVNNRITILHSALYSQVLVLYICKEQITKLIHSNIKNFGEDYPKSWLE